MLANTAHALFEHFRSDPAPFPPQLWTFHVAIATGSLTCAAAWWITRKPLARPSATAIAACIANIAFGGLPFLYFGSLPSFIIEIDLLIVAAGIAGIVVFSRREIVPAAAPRKPGRVAGDRTHPWVDKASMFLFAAILWVLSDEWYRFGWNHHLHFVSLLPSLLFIFLASLATSTLHECGHALAAARFKMKLLIFNAGPFCWRKREGRWKFKFNLAGLFGGSIEAIPTRPDQPDWQTACMLAAGPIANLCTTPLFLWAALHVEGTRCESAWLLLGYMATFSLMGAVFNLFPIRTSSGQYSDGAHLLQLFTASPVAEYHRALLRLRSTLVTTLRFRDLDPAPFLRAANLHPHDLAGLHAQLCAAQIFEDSGRIAEASVYITAAEAIYDANSIDLPAPLHTCFICFHACRNRDAAAARLWWDRMQTRKIERKNVDYWLASSALCWVEGRIAEAEDAWSKAGAEAQTLPHFGAYDADRDRVAFVRTLLDGPTPEPVAVPARLAPPPVAVPDPSSRWAETRRALLVASGVTFAVFCGLAGLRFHSYADAAGWHCLHGNVARLGSYSVRLPLPWRTLDDRKHGLTSLLRAGAPDFGRQPKIILMPADPDDPPPASNGDPDRRELNYAREYIARVNRRYSSKGWSASLVALKPKPFPLYCERIDHSQPGEERSTEMYCRVGRTGDMFLYTGPASREPEAESILSSIN